MSSKKIINGKECEKLEVVSLNINGEDSNSNKFTGEYISKLSKDGPIVINIETLHNSSNTTSPLSASENVEDRSSNESNIEKIYKYKKYNKNIFIGISITAIAILTSLIIF
ncbi:MAG: hypothetical protein ACRCYC_15740 [Paraclostridium sp.]|uniref:hypothetical protein n=1 Tax=Paraclostridium sp. TaxID=2023273 RepID=UPI003F2FB60D